MGVWVCGCAGGWQMANGLLSNSNSWDLRADVTKISFANISI